MTLASFPFAALAIWLLVAVVYATVFVFIGHLWQRKPVVYAVKQPPIVPFAAMPVPVSIDVIPAMTPAAREIAMQARIDQLEAQLAHKESQRRRWCTYSDNLNHGRRLPRYTDWDVSELMEGATSHV